jgi:hypothetical protein
MLKYSFIKNDFLVCLFGTLGAYNLIDWIFFIQKFPNDFYLYGTIGFLALLYLLIFKALEEKADLISKIIGFVVLAVFLKGQIQKINFLPITAIYYSETYADAYKESGSTTREIRTIFFKTKEMNCNKRNQIIVDTNKQPIDSWECLSCNTITTNELNKIFKPDFDDYSFSEVSCYLNMKYFIFSGTAIANGFINTSNDNGYLINQFFQYQIEALIHVTLSIILIFFVSFLIKRLKTRKFK